MPMDLEQARFAMIEQQIRPWEVLDPAVLETLSAVRREDFVPARYRRMAFTDMAIPLEHGETMMKPVLQGRLLQSLDIRPDDEILEIGTGTGFMTACLARLGRSVTSIDLHADFVERARSRVELAGFANARFEQADAMAYAPGRQFDVVAVNAAVAAIPEHFRAWLKPGGRMFIVRGHAPAMEAVLVTRVGESGWREESLFETDLPYLRGAEPAPQFQL